MYMIFVECFVWHDNDEEFLPRAGPLAFIPSEDGMSEEASPLSSAHRIIISEQLVRGRKAIA